MTRRTAPTAGPLAMTCVATVSVATIVLNTAFAQPSVSLKARVADYDADRRVVAFTLPPGQPANPAVNDRLWILDADTVKARGRVFLTRDRQAAGKIEPGNTAPGVGDKIILLRHARWPSRRRRLPLEVSLRGHLARLAPARRTGWIDLGRNAALNVDDHLLVRREGIPIARGRIALLERATALVAFTPLVANAYPQPADRVELWPAPAQTSLGRVNSTILAIHPHAEGALLTLVGTAADGLTRGQLVDLFRDERYVGMAELVDVADPLSIAQMIDSVSAIEPEVGDRAIVRPSSDAPPGPLRAAIFRVAARDYCLLAAGESDAVAIGETFVVRRPAPTAGDSDRAIAELTIKTVKVQHSGASIRMIDEDAGPLLPWDLAERTLPPWPRYRKVGTIVNVSDDRSSAFAHLDDASSIQAGDVIRSIAATPANKGTPGAMIVLDIEANRAFLYHPAGWGTSPQPQMHVQQCLPCSSTIRLDPAPARTP